MTSTRRRLITSKTVFTATIIVAILIVISIWLFGLGEHRTIFANTILSTSILSIIFFIFLTVGLYVGIKLKDDIGKLIDKAKPIDFPDLSSGFEMPSEMPELGEGIVGIILGILAWIAFSILILIAIWVFGAILWTTIIIFAAMLYWILFRALRLVFKNANKCKGNLSMSLTYGFGYTLLYSFWIYGIILISHYLV